MHGIKIVTLVALLAAGGLLVGNRAEALPLQGAPAIGIAADQSAIRHDVRYTCRRVWRCGAYSCGWRRACNWTPGPYAYAPAYRYGYRPYWRPAPRYWSYRYRRPYRRW